MRTVPCNGKFRVLHVQRPDDEIETGIGIAETRDLRFACRVAVMACYEYQEGYIAVQDKDGVLSRLYLFDNGSGVRIETPGLPPVFAKDLHRWLLQDWANHLDWQTMLPAGLQS